MRMLSFQPFSAARRLFPVIRRQCKHSLSSPLSSGLIANSVFDGDRAGVSAPLCLPPTMAPLCAAFLRGFRVSAAQRTPPTPTILTLWSRSIGGPRRPPRSGVNGEPTASIEGSAWIVTRRYWVPLRGGFGPPDFSSFFFIPKHISIPHLTWLIICLV